MAHVYLANGDRIEVKETEQEVDDMIFVYRHGVPQYPAFIKLTATAITRADQHADCYRVNVSNIVYYR
jgi:hypothetical protein